MLGVLVPSQSTSQAGTRVQKSMWTSSMGNWGLRLTRRRCAQEGLRRLTCSPLWQHMAHALSNCTLFLGHSVLQPELALSPRSCHGCPGHTCLCMGLHPHPWPWSRKQRCF